LTQYSKGIIYIDMINNNSIEAQTGWRRPYPKQILQDSDVLLKITEYDFDLNDREFVKYFISRTGILVGSESNPKLARFLLTDPSAENWMRESPDFQFVSEAPGSFGKRQAMTIEDREDRVRFNRIIKGRLQDAWELYKTERELTYDI